MELRIMPLQNYSISAHDAIITHDNCEVEPVASGVRGVGYKKCMIVSQQPYTLNLKNLIL